MSGFLSGLIDPAKAALFAKTDPSQLSPGMDAGGVMPTGHGLGGAIGAGLRRMLDPAQLAMTQALASGDGPTAAHLAAQFGAARQAQAQAQAAQGERMALLRNLVAPPEQGGMGLSPGEAMRAMIDPAAFAHAYDSRYETREIAPDHVRYQPEGGAPATTWTAPRSYEQGADVVRIDPNSGTAARFEGMTRAEQEARGIGLVPGTADYDRFLRDRDLRGQGPTASELRAAALAARRGGVGRRITPVQVASPAEAAGLPSGTAFITHDDQPRIRH